MCIRDRVSPINTFEAKITEPQSKRILTEEELLEIQLTDNTETINFFANVFQIDQNTLMDKLRLEYKNINLLNSTNLGYTLSAVSYTHLDVYKRQLCNK